MKGRKRLWLGKKINCIISKIGKRWIARERERERERMRGRDLEPNIPGGN